MGKVKLPDIRKNKLSVIIKSLEKRDAALQRFQRRDLYNAKSVKLVENTQIELYLPTLCSDGKGKAPTWNHSTQVGRAGGPGRNGKIGAPGEGAGCEHFLLRDLVIRLVIFYGVLSPRACVWLAILARLWVHGNTRAIARTLAQPPASLARVDAGNKTTDTSRSS